MVQSFDHWDPIGYGFDATVEFPPHGLFSSRSAHLPAASVRPGFHGRLLDYQALATEALARPVPTHTWFRGVTPQWDNTPRRQSRGIVCVGSSPGLFRRWLEDALRYTYLFRDPPERLVFVNAWNEWAEGAYLEPDATNGSAYLLALNEALRATHGYALETARILQGGALVRGLVDEARREWRARSLRQPGVDRA